jgi:hypothetical protein
VIEGIAPVALSILEIGNAPLQRYRALQVRHEGLKNPFLDRAEGSGAPSAYCPDVARHRIFVENGAQQRMPLVLGQHPIIEEIRCELRPYQGKARH